MAPPVPLNAEQIQQVEAKIAEARARAVTLKKEVRGTQSQAQLFRFSGSIIWHVGWRHHGDLSVLEHGSWSTV